MRTLSLIIATFFLLFGAVSSRGAVLTRISDETGVPVDTLQAERASTGLGYGELENAHTQATLGKSSIHGKSATSVGKGNMSTKGVGRGSSVKSGRGGFHGTGGM